MLDLPALFKRLPCLRSDKHDLKALYLRRNGVGLGFKNIDPLAEIRGASDRLVLFAQCASSEIFPASRHGPTRLVGQSLLNVVRVDDFSPQFPRLNQKPCLGAACLDQRLFDVLDDQPGRQPAV